MTLRHLLIEAAAGLADAESKAAPGSETTWSRAGQAFAVLSADGSACEFRLDTPVAAAAQRTPDVSASERGPGWVLFRPALLDDHGADRAVAWFASAHRRVAHR